MKKVKDQIRQILVENYELEKEVANQVISQLDTKKVYKTIPTQKK